MTAAGGHSGAMLALVPSNADLARLFLGDGHEPVDQLHCTLFFLGDATELTDPEGLAGQVQAAAAGMAPVEGHAFSASLFNPLGDEPCWVLQVGGDNLEPARTTVGAALNGMQVPEQHAPWAPHITLTYLPETVDMTEVIARTGPVVFDRVRLAVGEQVHDYRLSGSTGEVAMPWHVVSKSAQCPPSRPYAVVRDADGRVEGCSETLQDAEAHMAALYASEADGTGSMDAGPGWSGVLAPEGLRSGDGRVFAPGALTWRDLPLPLLWQPETADGHDGSVIVGRIDRIWREDGMIRGRGVMDDGSAAGQEAIRLMSEGFLRSVSVSLDDVGENDVELIYPPGAEGDLLAMPEEVIFHAGRIISITALPEPAFQEAVIALDAQAVTAAAAPVHHTDTVDAKWDGAAAEKRLPSPLPEATARKVYAWVDETKVDNGELPKSAASLPHHEVSADGTPGAANLAACSAGIGVLNGGRGGTSIPTADHEAVHAHLSAHLEDAGRSAPSLAAAGILKPPAHLFANPGLDGPTPITVDGDRVFGHLACWGTCHTSFGNACVTPPKEDDFSYFTTGEVLCADGSHVPVGHLTLGCGHAPSDLAHGPTVEHYDHSGHVVADVAAGADRFGIWVAGVVRPGTSDTQVHALRASALSGDWRRIGGRLRLVAALCVNVPGFPIPRLRSRVASGEPMALVAAGIVRRPDEVLVSAVERIAASIGRDSASLVAELAERVHA